MNKHEFVLHNNINSDLGVDSVCYVNTMSDIILKGIRLGMSGGSVCHRSEVTGRIAYTRGVNVIHSKLVGTRSRMDYVSRLRRVFSSNNHLVICQIVRAHHLSRVHWILEARTSGFRLILGNKRGSGLECRGVFSFVKLVRHLIAVQPTSPIINSIIGLLLFWSFFVGICNKWRSLDHIRRLIYHVVCANMCTRSYLQCRLFHLWGLRQGRQTLWCHGLTNKINLLGGIHFIKCISIYNVKESFSTLFDK